MLSHAVYFTLKNRSPQAAADLVAACQSHLAGHPGTLLFAAGPCSHYDRQVNDRDYDVALVIVFASHAAHDAYQQAPRHQAFIAAHATSWARVRIFDSDLAQFDPQAFPA